MCKRVPKQVSHDSDKDGTNDQCKSCGSTKMEFTQMTSQPALNRVWQKPHQWQLYERMEEPKHKQRKWKSQNECAEQSVPKPAVRSHAKKIFEVWCEGADQQSGKYEAEASKRQSSGSVC